MMRLRVLASVGILTVALLGCTSGDDSSSGTVTDDSGGVDHHRAVGDRALARRHRRHDQDRRDLRGHRAAGGGRPRTTTSATTGRVHRRSSTHINEDGGINGRKLELVIAPIDPTNPSPAEEKCVKLTEDDDVFVVTGFYLTDAVTVP